MRCNLAAAWTSDHVRGIGSQGRIGPEHVLEAIGRHAGAHRQREEIDRLIGVRPQEMGAHYPAARWFDQKIEPRERFAGTT